MSLSTTEFFLQYTERVLGLRALPRPTEAPRPRLLIADIPWPAGLANDDMFQKMMTAIGLSPKSFEVIETLPSEIGNLIAEVQGRDFVLSFSKEVAESFTALKESNPRLSYEVLFAMGPRDLRQDPSKKRATWDQLKELQSRLQS